MADKSVPVSEGFLYFLRLEAFSELLLDLETLWGTHALLDPVLGLWDSLSTQFGQGVAVFGGFSVLERDLAIFRRDFMRILLKLKILPHFPQATLTAKVLLVFRKTS